LILVNGIACTERQNVASDEVLKQSDRYSRNLLR